MDRNTRKHLCSQTQASEWTLHPTWSLLVSKLLGESVKYTELEFNGECALHIQHIHFLIDCYYVSCQ